MSKQPWRFQGDIAYGETDPIVTVFMGQCETDEDGHVAIRQDARNPLQMKLSEFESHLDLVNADKLESIRIVRKNAASTAAAMTPAIANGDGVAS